MKKTIAELTRTLESIQNNWSVVQQKKMYLQHTCDELEKKCKKIKVSKFRTIFFVKTVKKRKKKVGGAPVTPPVL